MECNCSDLKLFEDICKYPRVPDWIEAIITNKAKYNPMDCAVKFDGEWHPIIYGSEIVETAQQTINKLKKLPARYRNMPNDTICIEADSFENELFINLDGE